MRPKTPADAPSAQLALLKTLSMHRLRRSSHVVTIRRVTVASTKVVYESGLIEWPGVS